MVARICLARAAAQAGDTAKSRQAYQDVLAMCKDADPDVPLLQEVKRSMGAEARGEFAFMQQSLKIVF